MPAESGTGSKTSPIALDDSEEEVIQELTPSQFYGGSPGLSMDHLASTNGFIQSAPASLTEKKRKREDDIVGSPVAGSSTSLVSHQAPTLENRLSQPERKRVRKRRKKQQRQSVEQRGTQSLNWLNNPHLLPPKPSATGFLPNRPLLHSRFSEHEHVFGYDDLEADTSEFYLDYGLDDGPSGEVSYAPSAPPLPLPPPRSSWVSSMAMVADPVPLEQPENDVSMWSPCSPPTTPLPQPSPLPSPPPLRSFLPPRPRSPTFPVHMVQELPKRPLRPRTPTPPPSNLSLLPRNQLPPTTALPSSQVEPINKPVALAALLIGQTPDLDPNSKHGVFRFDPTSVQPHIKTSQRPPKSYAPNPARTLVMEQLPKVHRTVAFVEKWARGVCGGVGPLHVFVDTQSSKALVEFSTADLARKAFASPRLGQDLMMVKATNLLKGRPRTDQIKAWWYRVDGVGAGAGVGEIEEGEIEDDQDGVEQALPAEIHPPEAGEVDPADIPIPHVGVKPQPSASQTESKKQRKARQAKAREQRRVQEMLVRIQSSQMDIADTSFSLATPMVSTVPSLSSTTLPPLQIPKVFSLPPLPHELPPPLPSFLPSTTPYPFDVSYPFSSPTSFSPQDWSYSNVAPPTFPEPSLRARKRPSGPPSAVPQASTSKLSSSTSRGSGDRDSSTSNNGFSVVSSTSTSRVPQEPVVSLAPTTRQDDDLADYEDVGMDVSSAIADVRPVAQTASERPGLPKSSSSLPHRVHPLHPSLPPKPTPIRQSTPSLSFQSTAQAKKGANQSRSVNSNTSRPFEQSSSCTSTTTLPPSLSPVAPSPLPSQADAFKAASTTADPNHTSPPPLEPELVIPPTSTQIAPSTVAPPAQTPELAPLNLPSDPPESNGLAKQALLLKERLLHEKIARSRLDPTAAVFKLVSNDAVDPLLPPGLPSETLAVTLDTPTDRPSTPSQVMEESLRKMVLATKRTKTKSMPLQDAQALAQTPYVPSPTGLPTPPPSAPFHAMHSSAMPLSEDRPSSPLPPSLLPTPSTIEISLEELAVSFITQTIETFKDKSIFASSASSVSGSIPPSTSPTPPPPPYSATVPPLAASPVTTVSSASAPPPSVSTPSTTILLKSELALKQRRIEQHIEESKSLMERISQSKTRAEKDLLMKIMREKTRLFEEESKASERKIAKLSSTLSTSGTKNSTKTKNQSQRWPTTKQEHVLILSDSEDEDDMKP